MKYLMLLTNPSRAVAEWEKASAEERTELREAEIPKWGPFLAWLGERGIEADGLELDLPKQSKVVRVRDDVPEIIDGPFAETKEVLGGYFVAECADLDEAIEFASRIPVAETGSVEIRPLVE